MISITTPEHVAAWLERLESSVGDYHPPYNPDYLKSIIAEIVQLAQAERYMEISHLLEGSPYPQLFNFMAGDGGEEADVNDWYRLGLLLWIRGTVFLQNGQTVESNIDWHTTRTILDKLISNNQQRLLEGDDYDDQNRPERTLWHENIAWYQERLKDLNIDLACNAEEVYGWIHGLEGEEQVLRTHTRQMWQIIATKIKNNEWHTVEKYLEELVDFSDAGLDYLEKPEVLALCGRALHQIHMYPLAASYMRRAVAEFHPRSHKQAAARWMLGTVQWCVEWEQRAAIENLELSIEEFEQLQISAQRKDWKGTVDGQVLKAWYGERLEAMRKVLADRIQKRYP
jgi:hypothetical protein